MKHQVLFLCCLWSATLLVSGCDDSATSYSRFDQADTPAPEGQVDEPEPLVEPEPLPEPDPTPDPSPTPSPDVPPETTELPEGCPWMLTGCFSMISEMECGPFGCEVATPTHLWVDALPCLHAPVDVHMDIEGWTASDPLITAQGHLGFNLAFEGAGQTFCVIELPDEHYYPSKVSCAGSDNVLWEAALFENPSLCTDCPQLEGCYALHGLGEVHSVGLVQEGCAFQIIAEPHEGQSLQPGGSIGPTGNMIFRSVGQVADNICVLTTDEGPGLACAFTQLGMPTPITLDPDVRLVPQDWDQCPSVGCLEDEDCVDDPLGRTCDFGRCVCSGRSPCDEGQICVSNEIEESVCVAQ